MDGNGSAGLAALRGLHRALTRLSGERDLDATLQAVVEGVVEAVGFSAAAVNCVRADGAFEVRAVAGSPEARAALLGSVAAPDAFEEEFALADRWGTLRFVPHERLAGPPRGWVPPVAAAAVPDAWHPEDALYAPMHAASGELVGVLSVDLPRDGARPGPLKRELLEVFAAHAGIAIDNALLAERLHRDHERLRASEESLSLAFAGSDVGMAMIELGPADPGRFLRVNPALSRMTGYSAEELTAMRVGDLCHPEDLAANRQELEQALREGTEGYGLESRYLRADQSVIWVSATNSIIRNASGEVLYGFVQAQDISARRVLEDELVQAATRDPLTGLANRTALEAHLCAALTGAHRSRRPGAVVFCDLDGFKAVNDTLGHEAGDTVLRAVAGRLQAALREGDVVARLGGDEFVLVVQDIDEPGLCALAERLLHELAQPIAHGGRVLTVTASLGLTVVDDHVADAAALLRRADLAMYEAKQAGRNRHAFSGI